MTASSERLRMPIDADASEAASDFGRATGPAPARTAFPARATGFSNVSSLLSSVWQGAWSRQVWTNGALARLAMVFLLLGVCSWLGIMLSRQSEGVATIWLSNGILFGLVITRPPQQWLAYLAAGVTADTLADMVYGDPFRLAAGVSVANSVEVMISCFLLTLLFGTPLNLSKRQPLIGFLLVSVVGATALTSALGASWTLLFVDNGPWWQLFRTWYLGDILGMAIIAPLVFMLQRPGFFSILRREQLPRTLLVLLVPAITTVLVFTHDRDPLTFFIFPALLLVVFQLGFSGTVLTIFLLALLSIGFTVKGHGPLMLITGEHALLHRIVIDQIFLSVAIFTMFPVAALLEEREALQGSLAASEARHRRLAHADELTGLYNRRAFNTRLETDWQHAVDAGEFIALLLLDADLFKNYNDIHGHLGGDECLRLIAGIIAESSNGEPRTAARFGGEEFAIILPGEDAERAQQVAEQVRQAILEMKLPNPSTSTGVQTVSLGVVALVPQRGQHVMELISLADRALYRAKDLGRNRVVVA